MGERVPWDRVSNWDDESSGLGWRRWVHSNVKVLSTMDCMPENG